MRHLFTAALAALVLLTTWAGAVPPNWGEKKAVTFEEFSRGFRDPSPIYSPFMFWFWDEPLNPAKQAEMARRMTEQRISPGYAHARSTAPGVAEQNPLPPEQFLSPLWFDDFAGALEASKAGGQPFGFCDEYMWPTYQLAGRMLAEHPEFQAEQLVWETHEVRAGESLDVPVCAFAVAARRADEPGSPRVSEEPRLGAWVWKPTPGVGRHHAFLRRAFEIPEGAEVVSAQVRLTCDDRYTLYVNGREIGSHEPWYDVLSYDIKADLHAGRNTIAVDGGGDGGTDALCLGLRVELADGTAIELATDPAWVSSEEAPEGWAEAAFDDTAWAPVRVLGETSAASPWNMPASGKHVPARIASDSLEVIGAGEPFSWTAPAEGDWRVYVFRTVRHGVVNYLDERVPPVFFREALDPYFKRFGTDMGTAVPGVFNDCEGQYGIRLAWSDSLDRAYRERTGRDIRTWMPLLFEEDAEGRYATARCDWYDSVAEVYARVLGAESDYLAERGVYLTAHLWEESLQWQSQYVGDEMRLMRAFTMPGVDALGTGVLEVRKHKDEGSVAEFEGRRFMCEAFGAGGWGVLTPEFLKQGTNALFSFGVGHVIPHAVFSNRNLAGNVWTPDFYDENPMFPYLHLWADFVRRGSYVNSHGQLAADVLLLNPLESVWVAGGPDRFDPAVSGDLYRTEQWYGLVVSRIEDTYADAIRQLTAHRVQFLVGDRHYLGQMEVEGDRLVRGDLRFRTVVLPPLVVMRRDVAGKLLDFARGGGLVYALGELPSGSWEGGMGDPAMAETMATLSGLPSFHRITEGIGPALAGDLPGLAPHARFVVGEFPMLDRHIRVDGRDLFWYANNTDAAQDCVLDLPGIAGEASRWDCETGAQTVLRSEETEGGARVALHFEPYEAFWLVFDPRRPASAEGPAPATFEVVTTLDGPWSVTIDPAVQPEVQFPQEPPADLVAPGSRQVALEPWDRWGLDRFSGLMDYTCEFEWHGPAGKGVSLDLGALEGVADVRLNGAPVGERLWPPYRFALGGALHEGRNQLWIRVGNLINPSYGQPRTSGLLGPVRLLREK